MKDKTLISLYKAQPPFFKVKKGYGYQGVVMYDPIEKRLQCHICGKFFKTIGQHIKKHNVSAIRYREIYGLNRTTSLSSPLTHSMRSKQAYKLIKKRSIAFIKAMQKKAIKARKGKTFPFRVQNNNKNSTCKLQIKSRFDKIHKKMKRLPKFKELDSALGGSIEYYYGKYSNFLKHYKIEHSFQKTYSKKELVRELKDFKKNFGREPHQSDIKGNKLKISLKPFTRIFGSWEKAKSYAYSQNKKLN